MNRTYQTMEQQFWTIGSHPDCHLVVDDGTVSGEHCRLTLDGGTIVLDDLGSTNGTYVNGEMITEPRVVNLTDRITLGLTQVMPWPRELKPTAILTEKPTQQSAATYAIEDAQAEDDVPRTVITIGRSSQNSVVLNGSNVSNQHARMTIFDDWILLEDLGSTNGTAVGTIDNRIHRAQISKRDVIYFGSTPYRVVDLIKQHKMKRQLEATSELIPGKSSHRGWSAPQVWITAASASAAILLTAWVIFGRGDANHSVHTAQPKTVPVTSTAASTGERQAIAAPELSPEERLARSLFVIVAADPDRLTPFRVGTGFAIDAHHVATTGSVISTLQSLQEHGFSNVFLYCPATRNELNIANTVVHANYLAAGDAARTAQSDYESLIERYETDPPPLDRLETVKQQILAAQEAALLALDRKTTSDVAVIETKQSLEHWLEGASPDAGLRPNLKLSVKGLAHDLEDPFFDPQSLLEPDEMTSRVRRVTRVSAAVPVRLLAEATAQQRELAYFGSPVLNPRGEVVAVYSRPTPPVTQEETVDPPLTFDAPLFDRVRECLRQKP